MREETDVLFWKILENFVEILISKITKLILDIPNEKDLDILLPLLSRLKIHFTTFSNPIVDEQEIIDAIKIVEQGCEMDNFGDAMLYQVEIREDRILPFS